MNYLSKEIIDDILFELRSGYMVFSTNVIERQGFKQYQIVRYDLRNLEELRKQMYELPPMDRPREHELISRVASFKHELRINAITDSEYAWHQIFMYAMRDITQRFLINYEVEPFELK